MLIVVLSLITFSCQDNNDVDDSGSNNSEVTDMKDNAQTENEFNDLGSVSRDATTDTSQVSSARFASTCYKVTFSNDNNEDADSITFDFEDGCEYYGRYRKGKIILAYTGNYRDSGTVVTTTLEEYYADGIKVEGTRVATNKGETSNGEMEYEVKVTGAKLTFSDGGSTTWSTTRTSLVVENNTPYDITDDEVSVYGTSTGVNRFGNTRTSTVESSAPLVFKGDCKDVGGLVSRYRWFPVSGIKKTKIERNNSIVEREFDFGNGDCDKSFTVTVFGITFPVSL